jgi:hypothetical protein
MELNREGLQRDIDILLDSWGSKDLKRTLLLERFGDTRGEAQLNAVRVDLKHFLEDMRSVLNYKRLMERIPADKGSAVLTAKDPDYEWFMKRLEGRGALRNIVTHDRLPAVEWTNNGETTESKGFVCDELIVEGGPRRALFVQVHGTFEGVLAFLSS